MKTLGPVIQRNIAYVALLLVVVIFAIVLRDQGFFTVSNLTNIVIQAAPISVMAVGMVLVLSAREIDLSIGSVAGLTALIAAITLQAGWNPILAALAALSVALACGLFNSFFVTVLGMPSFLVTLATLSVILGIARLTTDLKTLSVSNEWFVNFFGTGTVLGIPSLVLWTGVITALGYVTLNYSKLGAHILATGDNPQAAASQGISIRRIRVIVLSGSAVAAGLAGLLYAGRLQSAAYTMGASDTLTVIAAVVVGGTSLFGGRGNMLGALAGSVLLATLTNGLLLAGLNVSQQIIIQGLVLLIAVAISLPRGTRSGR